MERITDGEGLTEGREKKEGGGSQVPSPFLCVMCRDLLFDGFGYFVGQSFHFVGFHLDVVMEIEVSFGLHGNKVDVGVGHFETQHGNTDFDTGAGFFEALCHTVCEALQFAVELFVEVEDVVDFFFRDAEYVAFDHRVYIEEGKAVVGFGNFVARYFTSYDT